MIFTQRFNEILKVSGASQSALAEYCHISKQCVTDYKQGRCVPSLDTLFRICKYLDVSSDYLLGLSDY